MGDIRDEVSATQVVERHVCVDVGSLNYDERELTNNRKALYVDPPLTLWAPPTTSDIGHVVCPKFNLVTQGTTWSVGDVSVLAATTTWGGGGGNVAFCVSPNTTAAQFKAANAGVLLVGELATPIAIPLPRRLDLSYPVSLATTESVVPSNAVVSVGETKPYTAPVITTNDYGIAVSEYLPNGYRRLEWIASTGAQYINSNIIPTYLTELELKFKCTNNFGTGFSSRWTGSPEYDTFGLFASPISHKLISYFGRYSEGLYNASDATYDAGTEIVYGLYQDKIVINQSIINITRSDIGFENAIPIYLLAQNNTDTVITYNATTRIYYARLYDNGRLLRNFIPCINSNSDIGMYDTITHAFFGNLGTSDFIAGPIIG